MPVRAQPAALVLKRFSGTDGATPQGALVVDVSGAIYGTAAAGGKFASGLVFELTPPATGKTGWTLTHLYDFCPMTGCVGGTFPLLFGAPPYSVVPFAGGANAYGTVFSLTPPAAGQTAWTYAVIHNFDFHDGAGPLGSLVSSSAGKIYGTASEAGAHGHGTAFELRPPTTGSSTWQFRVVYQF